MAETYTVVTTDEAFASGKQMLGVWNTDAAKIVKIRRVWIVNSRTTAVTGVVTTFELRLISARGGAGTAKTPVPHDSTNSLLPDGDIYIEAGATYTDSSVLRRVIWSNDEVAVSGATWDEWETIIPMCLVWDAGYGDDSVQAITLRQNQGFTVKHSGTTAVSGVDIMLEITCE